MIFRKPRRMIVIAVLALMLFPCLFFAKETPPGPASIAEIEKLTAELMDEGDIPGLSLVIIRPNQPVYIRSFGYADLEKKIPVTPQTRFEICSLTKAFTALAAVKLEQDGLLKLDAHIADYFPGFHGVHEGKSYSITIRQALNHTSGVPANTLSLIPEGNADNALPEIVKNLNGVELNEPPGVEFEYANTNYDLVGAVIEKVSGKRFEDYLKESVFIPLGMTRTQIGLNPGWQAPEKAKGYKIGFYDEREFDAPFFRGNAPAGYISSSAEDMGKWLQFQMGLTDSPLYSLAQKTHIPDRNVMPRRNFASYGLGWNIHSYAGVMLEHGGMNPNYSSYISFRPDEKMGIVLLSNSNSEFTANTGRMLLNLLRGAEYDDEFRSQNTLDGASSILTGALGLFILLTFFFVGSVGLDIRKGRRSFAGFHFGIMGKALLMFLFYIPFAVGIYLIPAAIANMKWDLAVIWSPVSFVTAATLMLIAMGLAYLAALLSNLFPLADKYRRSIPLVLVLSILSGAANAVVIFLITGSLYSDMKLIYQIYFYILAFIIYIMGRRIIQVRLTEITYQIVYDLRLRLVDKIFRTNYMRFEKLDRGRVYATINDDTGHISMAANILVALVTSIITTVVVFAYLATIAFWATALTVGVVVLVAILYSIVNRRATKLLEEARDTRNVFMGLLNSMLDGFKELSLSINKKREYHQDIENTSNIFAGKMTNAAVKFINAFMIGESMLLLVLGSVSFAIPEVFPDISAVTIMSFIMALLYLIGPVNTILHHIPTIAQIRVAWGRVMQFEKEIPATIDPKMLQKPLQMDKKADSVSTHDLFFSYDDSDEQSFAVGPINFEAHKGQITFIIGGNGSGKTTFAKLLTGLYSPSRGHIRLNGKEIEPATLGEYYSTVFSEHHLFSKLYDVNLPLKKDEAQKYLEILNLQDKVTLTDNGFSTVNLSGGQRKRLALLRCYLEDSPIYLFDEIAADQDPEFRRFFYRDLLIRMKNQGKIVMAITHDDHYFDVADQIIKFDMGKLDKVDADFRTTK